MGEANSEAIALIASLTGYTPESGNYPDGSQFLKIGDVVINATSFSLWSDPSVWVYNDRAFMLSWGGNNTRMVKDASGAWTADVRPDLLRGTARFIS